MNAIDTNILIYAHDPRDVNKQKIAITLIESLTDAVLLWQVACEYLSASRKLEPLGYSKKEAWQDIYDLRKVWTTIIPGWSVLEKTEQLLNKYSLSFWDAMLIATCIENKVANLYSEDFSGYVDIENLKIINPFKDL
jgi:predicted nucleic acid-binding protein